MKYVDILVFIFRIKYKPILSASLDVFEFFTRQDLSTLKVLRAMAVRGYLSIEITSTLSFYLFFALLSQTLNYVLPSSRWRLKAL